MKKTVIFLFLILCMTAVNTGCQKKQKTDFILENPKEHTDNEKQTEGNKDIKKEKVTLRKKRARKTSLYMSVEQCKNRESMSFYRDSGSVMP